MEIVCLPGRSVRVEHVADAWRLSPR
jgi:hypothetical protein